MRRIRRSSRGSTSWSWRKTPRSSNTKKSKVVSERYLEIIDDLTKKQRQELINKKIREREALFKVQAEKMSKIQNQEVERLNKQIEDLQKK